MSAQEALAVLKSHTPRVFDPAVLSVLAEAMGSEGLLHDLLEQRRTVLLVDSDGQDTVPLQVKLGEYGFETQVARNVRLAEKALRSGTFAAVVSEIDIEAQDDGLQLLHHFDGRDRQLVWIFVAHRHERDAVRKAFALGADDVVAKPTDPELLCSKIEQLVDRKDTGRVSTGVSGSLEQLSLPDLVQVLYHGRRSCALRLEFAGEQGIVHIVEGNIVDASWQNVRGSDAFFALVALGNAGRFSVDPNAPAPSQPTIDVDSEHLLLQAVQRLDEARAGS